MTLVRENAVFAASLLVVVVLTTLLARAARVDLGLLPLRAILRAAVQLGVVAALIAGIFAAPWTVALFLGVMLTTASLTAAGRLRALPHGRRHAVVAVLAGAVPSVALVFALHLVAWDVRYLIAVAGILIGNAMTAATLAGRTFVRLSRAHREVIEGWLALGATPRRAHEEIGREAVREAMLPSLDQTRATGLVTLPGAFVGALFGGASPVEAARFQLVVLAGVALTMLVTGVVLTRRAGSTPYVVPD